MSSIKQGKLFAAFGTIGYSLRPQDKIKIVNRAGTDEVLSGLTCVLDTLWLLYLSLKF